MMESRTKATEPITLAKCLEAFTQEEDLGEEDKINCAKCESNQQVTKKLQIWRLPPILIFHLKRFQNVNSRWIKSHKIVDFPLTNLDSTNYLAAVPSETLIRHKELVAGRSMSRKRGSLRSRNIGTIEENRDSTKNLTEDTVVDCDDPNDSGIETLERGRTDISDTAVFETGQEEIQVEIQKQKYIKQMPRTRQISTSLVRDPVKDDNLKDFHEHRLSPGCDPLDVQYKMYAMVCHSGVLGGGHYVSYSRAEENKWYCHNDSSCKEVPEANIDKSSAYILMYQREGLSLTDYLPDTTLMRQDSGDLDDELELDFKRQCSIM